MSEHNSALENHDDREHPKRRRKRSTKRILALLGVATGVVIVGTAVIPPMFGSDNADTDKPGQITNVKTTSKPSETSSVSETPPASPTRSAGGEALDPDNPDAGHWGQPDLDLKAANDKIIDCANKAVGPDNGRAVRSLVSQCFYSSPDNVADVYGLRSVGEISSKTNTEWYPGVDEETAKHDAHTVTHVYAGDNQVGDIECYWDVTLMGCKLQPVKYTQFGSDMKNEGVISIANINLPY